MPFIWARNEKGKKQPNKHQCEMISWTVFKFVVWVFHNFVVKTNEVTSAIITTEKKHLETTTFFPIYLSDQIVRRSESLLRTSQSVFPSLLIHPKTLELFSIKSGDTITLKLIDNPILQTIELKCKADFFVAEDVVAIANGHPSTNNIFSSQQLVSIKID